MKPTDKQIQANRANARKSTGPVTKAGKKSSSRNSLKHGLLAKEIVIDAGDGAENKQDFDALLADLNDQFSPQGPLEQMLVEKIAVAYWRLRRAHRYEVGLLRDKLDNAEDNFYKPDPYGLIPQKSCDETIDLEISYEQDMLQDWQADKKKLTKMRKAGKDLSVIYDEQFSSNWAGVRQKALENDDELSEDDLPKQPAQLREKLNKTGLSDDDIWQWHLESCDRNIASQLQEIKNLEREKQQNRRSLQVRKKTASIPAGHDLDRLLKYEGTIEKQFYRAINQLERLQRDRAGQPVPAPVKIDMDINSENQS